MARIRITAVPDDRDPQKDLRRLSDVRRDLYAHSPVEVDPDSPAHATRRDDQRRAYFEFATEYPDQVKRVLREYGHDGFVEVEELPGTAAEPCLRCGYVAEGTETPAVCPQCGLREISPCPNCNRNISRQAYVEVAGDLFRCPECGHRVRLSFNDPLHRPDGDWNEPVVLVESALPERV